MPTIGDNALLKLAPLLERLGERQPGSDLTDEPRALLRGLGEESTATPSAALERIASTTRASLMLSSRCSA